MVHSMTWRPPLYSSGQEKRSANQHDCTRVPVLCAAMNPRKEPSQVLGLISVSKHVPLESATLGRCIPTPRDLTRVRALSRVGAHVSLECATHRRSVPTPRDLTGERPLPCVGAHVRLESGT